MTYRCRAGSLLDSSQRSASCSPLLLAGSWTRRRLLRTWRRCGGWCHRWTHCTWCSGTPAGCGRLARCALRPARNERRSSSAGTQRRHKGWQGGGAESRSACSAVKPRSSQLQTPLVGPTSAPSGASPSTARMGRGARPHLARHCLRRAYPAANLHPPGVESDFIDHWSCSGAGGQTMRQ